MLTTINDPTEVEAAVYAYLTRRFPALAKCDADTPLLESGVIDSLGILELMTFLAERFGIVLEDEDFDPQNLETATHLIQFITRRLR
jgi:acyl carrier protein